VVSIVRNPDTNARVLATSSKVFPITSVQVKARPDHPQSKRRTLIPPVSGSPEVITSPEIIPPAMTVPEASLPNVARHLGTSTVPRELILLTSTTIRARTTTTTLGMTDKVSKLTATTTMLISWIPMRSLWTTCRPTLARPSKSSKLTRLFLSIGRTLPTVSLLPFRLTVSLLPPR